MTFNPQDFRHHLDGFDLSDAEKDDYIRTLAGVMQNVIDAMLDSESAADQVGDKSRKFALTAPDATDDVVDLMISNLFKKTMKWIKLYE